MTTLRSFRITGSAVPPKLRTYKISGSGTTASTPKLRTFKISGTGTVSILLNTIRTQSQVEPGTSVTFAATVAAGPASGITYAWRQISGPTVTLPGTTTSSITITAPSVMPTGALTVVLGVIASAGSGSSPEVTATLSVLPQTSWAYSGTAWVGAPFTQKP